jgi:predicted methyltransferase
MKNLSRFSSSLAAVALAAISVSFSLETISQTDAPTSAALDAALAGAHRSERNKARDQFRHPRETLTFFGLRRDMTVVEIWPGGGWYTEVLAPVLKGKGKLYATQYGANTAFEYQRRENEALRDKATKNPDVFGEVRFTAMGAPNELAIAPAGTADLVVTFRNLHNWLEPQYKQDPAKFFGAFFAALKPGGILGIVDHRWPDPRTEDPDASNGYVSQERAISLAGAAGFEFVGSSDINRNPKDTHDHKNGVWSLPPDLSVPQGEDKQQYIDIGESDRMTLKFRKPLGK